jgi:tetratricopeptide (TPR) repeat protein
LTANVEKSLEQAEAFFHRLREAVAEVEQFRDLYFQDVYVDVGRYRHEQGNYREALRCFYRSLRHGPNVKAVGAIGLTVIAASIRVPVRLTRLLVATERE